MTWTAWFPQDRENKVDRTSRQRERPWARRAAYDGAVTADRKPPELLFAPGFACTPAIWAPAKDHLPDVTAAHVAWHPGLSSVDAARDHLADEIAQTRPGAYIGHSLGGLLLLELLIAGRIHPRPTLIVDAFLDHPADLFKNFVWRDERLRVQVTAMLDDQRPRYARLRASIDCWQRSGWPEAAVHTGAHFVYGGRGASDDEVVAALGWPAGLMDRERVTILPGTSHFLMLEAPERFYQLVRRIADRRQVGDG